MKFETLQIHAGFNPDKETRSVAVPIYQTAAYEFDSADHAKKLFALEEFGNIYSRIMNPTTDIFEKRIAALEGGVGALAVSSGMAAITLAIQNIASAGDNIVSAVSIYGGTSNLFIHTLPKYGITTTLVPTQDYEAYEKAINDKTKAIFVESIGNPNGDLIDFEKVAQIAHKHNIPFIVDNTFASPYLFRPMEFGADIVIHSATKYINGHGNSIGGIIVDCGTFNWANGKFPGLSLPDPSYHDIVYTDSFKAMAFIIKARVQLLRDLGCTLSPFNAFLFIQGVETLSLRMERHVSNAVKVAEFLTTNEYVSSVNYSALKTSPDYALAQKYFPKGVGGIFTITTKGDKENARKFIESLKLFTHLANVGDSKSLAIHPASTTHSQSTPKELEDSNITPTSIRLSIGTENIEDLIEDLTQALKAAFN